MKSKSIVVIHDLAYFIPELNAYPIIDTLYMRFMIKSSIKRANHIVSVSSNTKKDILKITDADESKIKVVYEAADPKYRRIKDELILKDFKNKYNLADKFIFYSGPLSPRKNMMRLLVAYDKIKDKIPHKLVLTGGKSWNGKDVHQFIERLGDHIIKLGHAPDEDMPFIYNLADLFIYPSLYEGFGIVLQEAMQVGLPIVSTDYGGQVDFVKEEENGYLISYENVEALSSIQYFAKNRILLGKVSNVNRKQCDVFLPEKICSQYLEMLA
jgi:glycosyltransferase involved in cell wall biosynthesis